MGTVRGSQQSHGSQQEEVWRVLVLREGEGGLGQGRGRHVGAGGAEEPPWAEGPVPIASSLLGRPQAPWAQWPFPMMDRRGCPDVADVGLHLASIAPQGPRSMAACDEWLRIDFHLIDNLVNLFAESQVGPEREPRGSQRWGRGSLGWGGRQGAAEAGQPWEGGGRSRAHSAPAPHGPPAAPPLPGDSCSGVCVQGPLSSWNGVFSLVGNPQKRGCGQH